MLAAMDSFLVFSVIASMRLQTSRLWFAFDMIKNCKRLMLVFSEQEQLIISGWLLQMLEPRFTDETLSTLLSIPTGKSLLRRHLATHFSSLIGPDCQKVKEQEASSTGFAPLMPGVKTKVSFTVIKGKPRSLI